MFADRSFATWMWGYVILAVMATLAETIDYAVCRIYLCPFAMPHQIFSSHVHIEFLFALNNALITAQVGVLAVLSIAVSLVTLIGQNGNAGADVRVYYSESLTLPLVGSSVALLLILCAELIWPVQRITGLLGLSSETLIAQTTLTVIHLIWTLLNLAAFAHFAIVSLSFGNPNVWAEYRRRYTANQLVPSSLQNDLLEIYYANLSSEILPTPTGRGSRVWFSGWSMPIVELNDTFKRNRILHDIWLRPLTIALRRWNKRVDASSQANNSHAMLSFTIGMGSVVSGDTIWCRRRDGLALAPLERFLVRLSFRFKRVR